MTRRPGTLPSRCHANGISLHFCFTLHVVRACHCGSTAMLRAFFSLYCLVKNTLPPKVFFKFFKEQILFFFGKFAWLWREKRPQNAIFFYGYLDVFASFLLTLRGPDVFCKLIFQNLTKWQNLKNIFSSPRSLENIVQDEEKFAENRIENVLFWLEKSAFLFFFPRNMTHFKKN